MGQKRIDPGHDTSLCTLGTSTAQGHEGRGVQQQRDVKANDTTRGRIFNLGKPVVN